MSWLIWIGIPVTLTVQQRSAAIIEARGASSAASAANAAIDHMHDWALGSDSIVSMGVCSDGSYGIAEGLIYSFQCAVLVAIGKLFRVLRLAISAKEKPQPKLNWQRSATRSFAAITIQWRGVWLIARTPRRFQSARWALVSSILAAQLPTFPIPLVFTTI